MPSRSIRYRGAELPVIERFRVGGRTYLAVAKIGSSGRQAFQVFDPSAKQMRALHILPNSSGGIDHVRTLAAAYARRQRNPSDSRMPSRR